ncbi:TOPRIM domain containing protein [uncultured Caudovirales phage]|uniref:TOPRIM domain containing protein n=1 Tax=uncultured Caudovirales phage TaxID=2100421 RepID=A0A6J7WW61_9CAUD|nr:TOPRIM domain containing protein [uncultured Caudovirales phage]CAB5221095.1 TOPRIM domain containing protein [uncultured Caudovirales phage]
MPEVLHCKCPFPACGSSDAFDWNTDKRVGMCRSCGDSYPHKGMKVFDWATEEYPLKGFVNHKTGGLKEEEDMLDTTCAEWAYVEHRGIMPRTMETYGCKTYFDSVGEPIKHVYVYPDGGTKTRQFPKSFHVHNFKSDGLFGMNLFPAGCAEAVTITEGELDTMSAYQMLGSKYPVVSLPSATPSRKLLENAKDWLGSFKKIYLSLDSDEKADKFATSLMHLFPGRVYKVPHDKFKDANEFLQAGCGEQYRKAWWSSGLYTPENIYATEEKFLELLHDTPDHSFVPTGIADLDEKILGLMQGHFTVIKAPTGIGKCLSPDQEVLTYYGRNIKAKEVGKGDLLMGPDGTSREVLNVTSGFAPMYRITPTKGPSWECNEDHILCLVNTTTGKEVEISVKDYLTTGNTFKHEYKQFRSEGFVGFDWKLEYDPYVVGVYLGDGHTHRCAISLGDKKSMITSYVTDYFVGNGYTVKSVRTSNCNELQVSKNWERGNFWSYVQDIVKERHIPYNYKTSTQKVRGEVLSGILDTDGSVSGGCIEVTQKSERMADDIVFVARSLGLAAYKKTKVGKIASSGFEGTYYRVQISGDLTKLPLKRLKVQPRKMNKNVLRTGFTVEPIGMGKYNGFMLDGDHRFLLGDFTVTHNSEFMRYLEFNFIKNHPTVRFATWHLEETKLRSLLGVVSYYLNDNLTRKDLINDKGRMADVEAAIKDITHNSGYMQFHLDEADADGLVEQIRVLTQVYGCQYVFFEPIQDVVTVSNETNKETILADLSVKLSKLAADLNVGIITIAHTNENGDVKYCKMVAQRASVVIDLERDKEADNMIDRNTTRLVVKKNRPCGLEGDAGELLFDGETFTLSVKEGGW